MSGHMWVAAGFFTAALLAIAWCVTTEYLDEHLGRALAAAQDWQEHVDSALTNGQCGCNRCTDAEWLGWLDAHGMSV